MKQNCLEKLLNEKNVLLADGATGTNYFNMGLMAGDAPELWNDEKSEKVIELHKAFVDAGADIILSNTFGGNRNRLKLHKADNRVHELNYKAAQLARQVADEADRTVLVAGSVGPTGELFTPLGELTHDEAVDAFLEQMIGLKDGGADILWIETMSAQEEMEAAMKAAQKTEMEYVMTASFDTAGRTMMGIKPDKLLEIGNQCSSPPKGIGANCGVGATDLLLSMIDMAKVANGAMPALVAKANCGVPKIDGDQVVYSGDIELMADYARLAIDVGAKIIGGCCGTSPAHLAAMREAIDNHVQGETPSLETIVAKTGPVVNEKPTRQCKSRDVERLSRTQSCLRWKIRKPPCGKIVEGVNTHRSCQSDTLIWNGNPLCDINLLETIEKR